ncbi:MAG: FliI/YscN family ATPase [Proteobacteria bacterium]|nr:FliI/YscN family ATPase [Pseudomonadota bacterium]
MADRRARIIDGRVFDASEEARRILSEARQEADNIVGRARQEAASIVDRARQRADGVSTGVDGAVREMIGLVIRARVADVRYGDVVTIERPWSDTGRVCAEVVGFSGPEAVLMPLGDIDGIGPDCRVIASGRRFSIRVGPGLLGRVLDGLGRPIDGRGEIDSVLARPGIAPASTENWPVDRSAPNPMTRRRIDRPLPTGVRAVDGLLTVGAGQRVGLFASAGTGKSVLLGQIARASDADVIVIALIGERGREVREFLDEFMGQEGQGRSVVVCATSDAPSLVRVRAAHVATAIAEWFRDRQGASVLLLVDSLTRYARAQREVGLSRGEAPAQRGYPASVFAAIPRLIERAGNSEHGSMTAVYTVLVAGLEGDDPAIDEARAALDGHIALSPERAAHGQWPAIDLLASFSRSMAHVASAEHLAAARRIRALLAEYTQHRDLLALDAYRSGTNPVLDRAIAALPAIERYLSQPSGQCIPYRESVAQLVRLADQSLG